MSAERTHLATIVPEGGIRIPGVGSGLVAVTDSTGTIQWEAGAPTSGTAGGGLIGSYPDPQVLGFGDAWQPGVTFERHGDLTVNSTSQVTINSGYFWVLDPTSTLVRVSVNSNAVLGSIPAASASNFRLDQVVVDSTGVISLLQGTEGTTVTLDNRTSAANIPAGSMLLWDILVTSSGVTGANTWDRRSWAATGSPAVTTTLPVPVTGRECYYLADATNGVVWHLKARRNNPDTTRNTSSYLWEYIGGPSLYKSVTSTQSVGLSNVYADLSTPVSLTLPLAGDYDITIIANMFKASNLGYVQTSYRLSGGTTAAADDLDSVGFSDATTNSGSNTPQGEGNRTKRKTGLGASTVVTVQAKTNDTNAASVRWCQLMARPVRVG